MRDQYHYDERGAFPDYDPFEEDQRTHAQKVVDDNTWQKNEGIALDNDGNPFLEWCDHQWKHRFRPLQLHDMPRVWHTRKLLAHSNRGGITGGQVCLRRQHPTTLSLPTC